MREIFVNHVGWIEVPDFFVVGSEKTGAWDRREETILAACYGLYGLDFTARALNRRRDAVSAKAHRMGVRGRPVNGETRYPTPDRLGRVA